MWAGDAGPSAALTEVEVRRIVVIGGLNMDLHLFDLRASAGQAPLVAESYHTEPGGKGANVARAAARLGADVALVGRVGDDDFGRMALALWAAGPPRPCVPSICPCAP